MKQILLWMFFAVPLFAQAFDVPRHLPAGKSNFTWHSFYDACYSMETFLDSLPCNPAYLPQEEASRKSFGHLFFGSNDFDYLKDVEDLLNNRADRATLERVLNQNRSVELEADAELGSIRGSWAWALSPLRFNSYSLIRNRAMPYVSIYAAQEQVLRIQHSRPIQENLTAGIQLRGLHRKLILSDFFLTEALIEGGSERVLKVHNQTALFLEPGLVWKLENPDWKPKVAMAVTQLGAVTSRYEGLTTEPEGQIGMSLQPEAYQGALEVGVHASLHPQYEQTSDLLRLAGSYQLGNAQVSGSLNPQRQDIGLMFRLKALKAGALLDRHQIENITGQSEEVSTVYFELGLEI